MPSYCFSDHRPQTASRIGRKWVYLSPYINPQYYIGERFPSFEGSGEEVCNIADKFNFPIYKCVNQSYIQGNVFIGDNFFRIPQNIQPHKGV